MKYTYSDEEDEVYSDATTSRRSTRNTGTHTPNEGPVVTLSGRQVKSRQGGTYGESILSGAHGPAENNGTSEEPEDGVDGARPRRAATTKTTSNGWATSKSHIEGYNSVDEMDSDEDDASEQDYGDDEEEDDHLSLESDVEDPDDLPDVIENLSDLADEKQSLVVKLPVKTPTPERKVPVKQNTPEFEKATATIEHQESVTAPTPTPKEPSISTGTTTTPINIPTNQVPLSPLAFRGSPDKSRAFQPSIDVGYGGA